MPGGRTPIAAPALASKPARAVALFDALPLRECGCARGWKTGCRCRTLCGNTCLIGARCEETVVNEPGLDGRLLPSGARWAAIAVKLQEGYGPAGILLALYNARRLRPALGGAHLGSGASQFLRATRASNTGFARWSMDIRFTATFNSRRTAFREAGAGFRVGQGAR